MVIVEIAALVLSVALIGIMLILAVPYFLEDVRHVFHQDTGGSKARERFEKTLEDRLKHRKFPQRNKA